MTEKNPNVLLFTPNTPTTLADIHVSDFYNTWDGKKSIDCYDTELKKHTLDLTLEFNGLLKTSFQQKIHKIVEEKDKHHQINEVREKQGSETEEQARRNLEHDWYMFAGTAYNNNALVIGFAPHDKYSTEGYIHTSQEVFPKNYSFIDIQRNKSFLQLHFHGCKADITREKLNIMQQSYNLEKGEGIMEITMLRANKIDPKGEKIPVSYDIIPKFIHEVSPEHTVTFGWFYGNSMPFIVEILQGQSFIFFPRAEEQYRPHMKASNTSRQRKHIF